MAARRLVPAMGPGRHRRPRAIGASAATVLAGIHLDRLGRVAREAGYLGVLFAVAAAGFGWVAVRLLMADDIEAWLAGAALAVGVGVGYLLSCTVGLPGVSPQYWSGLGDISTSLAGVFLVATVTRSGILAPKQANS